MSKRPRPPWFWNTALLTQVTWLLLAVVFAAEATRVPADVGLPDSSAAKRYNPQPVTAIT
jgi:hypothetical protein